MIKGLTVSSPYLPSLKNLEKLPQKPALSLAVGQTGYKTGYRKAVSPKTPPFSADQIFDRDSCPANV